MSVAKFFKCLSDETRLRCLVLLQSRESLCVCDLAEALESSQPKISRHLAQLRACDLVSDRRDGQWVYYRLHPDLQRWQRDVLVNTQAILISDGCCEADSRRLAAVELRNIESRCSRVRSATPDGIKVLG